MTEMRTVPRGCHGSAPRCLQVCGSLAGRIGPREAQDQGQIWTSTQKATRRGDQVLPLNTQAGSMNFPVPQLFQRSAPLVNFPT